MEIQKLEQAVRKAARKSSRENPAEVIVADPNLMGELGQELDSAARTLTERTKGKVTRHKIDQPIAGRWF